LPIEHVRTTLHSIVKYNLRVGFRDFTHVYRVFADADDTGLLVCTWPHAGRPEIPVRYCDEVWTGIEYQVGAHCLMEGMVEEGLRVLAALRARYNGARRNPYNEIECGDHYARAMAGWSVLEAMSGVRYDALEGSIVFRPVHGEQDFCAPFIGGAGWGTLARRRVADGWQVELRCAYGQLELRRLQLDVNGERVEARVGDTPCEFSTTTTDQCCTLDFAQPHVLPAGETLVVSLLAVGGA
jgi:non-lysosomal glucosylceramidase